MQQGNSNYQQGAGTDQLINFHDEPFALMCIARVRSWNPPPNWSWHEWLAEITQVFWRAAVRLAAQTSSLSPAERVSVVCSQALARARTRYRQECAFAKRLVPLIDADSAEGEQLLGQENLGFVPAAPPTQSDPAHEVVRDAVAQLPREGDRHIIELLFREGYTEVEAAAELRTSQGTINKRKRAILNWLRDFLRSQYPEYFDTPTADSPEPEEVNGSQTNKF